MATFQTIVVSPNPKGHFIEGLLTAITPKPGTCLELTDAAREAGQFTYKVFTRNADGDRSEIIILTENWGLGETVDDAYVASSRFFAYIPLPGDEVQVLFQNVSGTGDDVVIGDFLIIDSGTGKVIVTTGSPQAEPFVALEAITDPTEDTLLWVRCTGN